jgi:hypothetical protein
VKNAGYDRLVENLREIEEGFDSDVVLRKTNGIRTEHRKPLIVQNLSQEAMIYIYLPCGNLRTFRQAPRNPGGRKICLRGVSKYNCQESESDHPPFFLMKFVKKLQLSYRVEAVVEQHSTLLSGFS